MIWFLLIGSHAAVAFAFYEMGRTDELLYPDDDRAFPWLRRRR